MQVYQKSSKKTFAKCRAMGFLISFFLFLFFTQGNALSLNYYEKTCPNVEDTITKVVTDAVKKDKTVPAALLRMHFHDCFLRV